MCWCVKLCARVCVCLGSDQDHLSVRGVLLFVEEEVESEAEDPCWTDRHSACSDRKRKNSLPTGLTIPQPVKNKASNICQKKMCLDLLGISRS